MKLLITIVSALAVAFASDGASCVFDIDCDSGVNEECLNDGGGSGSGFCSSGGDTSSCYADKDCKDTGATCVFSSSTRLSSSRGNCAVLVATGGECTNNIDCTSGFCSVHLSANSSPYICEERVATGGACTDDNTNSLDQVQCKDANYCSIIEDGVTADGKCKKTKAEGESCDESAECSLFVCNAGECKNDLLAVVGMALSLIVGSIVGGIVLCCCCCLAIWFFALKGRK